jgi:zinc finger protein
MESVLKCSSCGYRHVDGVMLEKKAPVRLKLKITSPDDMMIRVVRSSNATVEIPELGIKIIPGLASTGYITNVEGILLRIEEVLQKIGDKRKKKKAHSLLERIRNIKEGKEEAHLVMEDPTGNSAILSEKVLKDEI